MPDLKLQLPPLPSKLLETQVWDSESDIVSSVWLVSYLNSLKLSFCRNCDSSDSVRNGTEAFDFFSESQRTLFSRLQQRRLACTVDCFRFLFIAHSLSERHLQYSRQNINKFFLFVFLSIFSIKSIVQECLFYFRSESIVSEASIERIPRSIADHYQCWRSERGNNR